MAARFAVIAYPSVSAHNAVWLSNLAQQFPLLKQSILPPHFTFVFPLPAEAIEQATFIQHVGEISASHPTIHFVLRCAILMSETDMHYVFLAPDEGFSNIVRLHDTLYRGCLAPQLRLDIPFIPHITVGFASDLHSCKNIVDQLNSHPFEIDGILQTLDLISLDGNTARTIEQFQLT